MKSCAVLTVVDLGFPSCSIMLAHSMCTDAVDHAEREVKKATRDLNQLLNNIESPMTRLETVHKKYTELLADMKKLDRDYSKSKKRADQLQKDQEKGKSELNKTVTMKDKLEKLCRELTKENKKVKVTRVPRLCDVFDVCWSL